MHCFYQKSLDFRLDSGSSWLDGVNGILMQQEPNLLKQERLLEPKGYCLPCQHLIHSCGASSNAFTVFYAAATALEMPYETLLLYQHLS
jgi:hypothetical protein